MEKNSGVPLKEITKPTILTREMIFLAEQSADSSLKVLPGEKWSLHYPVDEVTRQEKLQGLLDGKYNAEDIKNDIKPNAIFYNIEDIKNEGLEKVSGKIRDLSSYIIHYDYPQFAKFVESMRGRNIPLEEIDSLYSEITKTRIQKKVMDSYGYTGRRQIEEVLQNEANDIVKNINDLPRSEKILQALKINWLSEDLGLIPMEKRDQVVSNLSGDERKLFGELESSYRDYIQKGSEKGYETIKNTVRDNFEEIQKKVEDSETSSTMKELEKELEKFEEQSVPPGSPEDTNIPSEDNDEYHTPPPTEQGESKETTQEKVIFEIEPALGGYYITGRKSYYDIDTKTWSKKKQLSQYNSNISGEKVATISGLTNSGIKAIPLPNSYALDISSLKYKGTDAEILRDQNGCFYIKTRGPVSFSIDFKKEEKLFINAPIIEDTTPIYKGLLSAKTEAIISRLSGSPVQKAEQVRQFILANHFYPGGGDLQKAGALQYKLRTESTGNNYLQNIDISEYLECYSANTLFIAMMRKAGVPARLVIGDKVEGAINGKSSITQNTGHAWSEIWDGKEWKRFDATPNAKPEDQKKDNKKKNKEKAEEANDGGIEKPQDKENSNGQNQPSSGNKSPLDQMGNVSDNEMKKSEEQLQQAKEKMEKINQKAKEINEKIQNTEKFKELSDLQKEIKESELFDDIKEEIEKKIEAKEKQIKDIIRDELDKMVDDGFMSEEKRDSLLKELEEKEKNELDILQEEFKKENELYNKYEDISEEIAPLVDKWFKYFAERLPKQDEIEIDKSSLMRQGSFDRKSVMKARNLLFGTVKNPKEIRPSIKPRFMSSVLVDVSGSMEGEKLKNAQKLLVFYSELFSHISQEFGYIRFSIDTFSDSVTEIKKFDQDYESPQRYNFSDGTTSTIKVRLMEKVATQGGTNMLDGIKKAAYELNEQVEEYPDYASAFYFIGDGGDTCGNGQNIKKFLQINDSEHGFGNHMYSAILLGNQSQRQELANIFGDEHTNVVPEFDELIDESMNRFDEDLEEYLKNKTF